MYIIGEEMRTVIVGSGAAGLTTASTINLNDDEIEILWKVLQEGL